MQNVKWHTVLFLISFLLAQNAFSAVVIVTSERFIQALAVATDGDGQQVSDNPSPIQVFGTDPLFDESTSASAAIGVGSASANSNQTSIFTSTGIEGNGSYSAQADYFGSLGGDGGGGAIALNRLEVDFTASGNGVQQRYRFSGNLTNFDASGNTASLSVIGLGGVTATNESVDFDFSGFLPSIQNLTLVLNMPGETSAATPPFGEFSQVSSGSYNFELEILPVPVPAAGWLFGSALIGLGWLKRKRTD